MMRNSRGDDRVNGDRANGRPKEEERKYDKVSRDGLSWQEYQILKCI